MIPLHFSAIRNGAQEGLLSLTALYDADGLTEFENRWEAFFASDPAHSSIFQKVGNWLRYQTGYFVPTVQDERPPVLLLFGNPASHSTRIGMCFSYEGKERQHRFWLVLAESGFLDFQWGTALDGLDTVARNKLMKERFFNVDYASPFRIGIAPILSMPSTASTPPWSGVGGLYKLFGKRAITILLEAERARVRQIVTDFLGEQGVLVAFQKDAYENTRLADSPPYSLAGAKATILESRYRENPAIPLRLGPPTRFWTGHAVRNSIRALQLDIEARLYPQE